MKHLFMKLNRPSGAEVIVNMALVRYITANGTEGSVLYFGETDNEWIVVSQNPAEIGDREEWKQ